MKSFEKSFRRILIQREPREGVETIWTGDSHLLLWKSPTLRPRCIPDRMAELLREA